MANTDFRRFSLFLALLLSPSLANAAPDEFPEGSGKNVARIFEQAKVEATLVLSSLDGPIVFMHNQDRARARFSPASTFKIVNTLIGLKTGAVTSRDSTFSWDSNDRGMPAWNQDHTLQSAFRVSCVWCYQEIARYVGKAKYRDELAAIGYGNQTIGDHVDQFWLDGSLKISATEQVGILRQLFTEQLPYSKDDVDELKAIMLDERTSRYALYGKTGWTGAGLHTGWYVGMVEAANETWVFAMNLEMHSAEQAPLRKKLALEALQALGII